MGTDRLRAKLVKAGFDEDEVFTMERADLLKTYAEYLINPPVVEEAAGGMAEGTYAEELELRRQELEVRRLELEMQRQEKQEAAQRRLEEEQKAEQRWQAEEQRRLAEKQEAEQMRLEEEQRRLVEKQEAEQRRLEEEQKAEQRRLEERTLKERELVIREQELERQRMKDEAELKRKESMAGQTKFYGDALNKVLRKMGDDPSELPTYFTHVENQFVFYNVPKQLQAKLLMPFLSDRARSYWINYLGSVLMTISRCENFCCVNSNSHLSSIERNSGRWRNGQTRHLLFSVLELKICSSTILTAVRLMTKMVLSI